MVGAVGTVALLVAWQLLSATVLHAGGTVPGPVEIVRQLGRDGAGLYLVNAEVTVSAAVQGYIYGNLAAIVLGVVALVVPALGRPITHLGVFSYCLPIVAIGPVLAIVFPADLSRVLLAGLSVFFTTLVATTAGLRAADQASVDLVTAHGGGRWTVVRKVRAMAALPSLFAGLQVAAPAALLGAIIGEYIGADSGLGVLMISSQQSMQIERTWAVALVGAALAGLAFLVVGLVSRLLLPWSTHLTAAAMAGPVTPARGRAASAVHGAVGLVIGVAAIVGVWFAFLASTGVSPFIGRSPLDVLHFLLAAPPAGRADPRDHLLALSLTTLGDAVLGLLTGVVAALVVASAFALSPVARNALMSAVLALRAIPMVAMAPLLVLVAGRGSASVAVIGGLVTFFPTLVGVLAALRRIPKDSADLMAAYAAGRWRLFVTVQAPVALSALVSSLRVAAPLAFTGALLAEWLATGQGLGYDMILSMTSARYDLLWTEVVIVTVLSFAVFALVGLAERAVAGMYRGSAPADAPTRSLVSTLEPAA
ncbi:ABC transporter permease [Microlunatus flavus]|uniref:ABC-type nitrate/sulfonate/bicarbonate transport system, permease component n=1 Tax=Microlunatus flavus TaxID=1036181 RepID=A0A1H9NC03_9ACTN|nr:ABC transporter permease subunit [Microlunatus flavus]SER33418.1 ABC-type nitrate/sulfonate/bicarbonate transport system, permease component [Microlunatus flavus]